MSVQQPAWLKRTRPCPFYSQGRCLFADSCNFLHDVKVRNSLSYPLLSTSQVKQPSVPPKLIFDPPSVVVDSASPLVNPASPESLASTIQDSSRYSGLLSVLSDVIGPPIPENAVPATSANPSSLHSTAHAPGLASELNVVDSVTSDVVHSEAEQTSARCSDPSSIHFDSEATLVSPSGYESESFYPQEDNEPITEFFPMPDNIESGDGDDITYFVEDTETFAIGSECSSDDDTDDRGEDFTVVVSNRQSTLSSFTGASLLASPRNGAFGEPNSVGDGDLLSPVELSAKLRPFPLGVKRGDSIDSGYADGDNWIGPLPFPRSPPGNARSPGHQSTFLHSQQVSNSFPAFKNNKRSYDVGDVRSSSHNSIEDIKEVGSDGCSEHGLEDDEDATRVILDAYGKLPSEEQEEDKARDLLQVNLTIVTEDGVEHVHSGGECDADSYDHPSFVSDDNVSFKTALSAQPSCEDLSNVSRVSPIKQGSLLPSISGCSTPNTSERSHYGDANGSSGYLIVGSDVYKSSPFLTTGLEGHFGSTEVLASDAVNQLSPEKVATVHESLPDVFHFNKRSPTPSTTDISCSSCAQGNESASQNFISQQEYVFGTPQSNENPPSSSPLEKSHSPLLVETSSTACPNDPQEISLRSVTVPQERPPSLLHSFSDSPIGETSCQSILGLAPAVAGNVQNALPEQCSTSLGLAEEGPHNPSTVENTFSCTSQDTGGRHNMLLTNVDTHLECQTSDFHSNPYLQELSSSAENRNSPFLAQDVLGHANGIQEIFQENIMDASQYASCGSGLDGASSTPAAPSEGLHNLSPPKDLDHIHLGADSGESLYLAGSATSHADQSLTVDSRLGFNETTECLDSECENFTQPLSFPLPPPFPPAEFIGYPTLSGEGPSALTELTVVHTEGDGSKACTELQQEEVQQCLGSDLTEKMRPSHLPLFGSPNSNADFTWRRSRAASDLTVKGKSSPTTILKSPPVLPLEQQGQVDPVNSFYDQYTDDTSDISYPTHREVTNIGLTDPSQKVHPQYRDPTFQRRLSSCSNGECISSGADSPRSETVYRPLLTGRRSFLGSSLAELVPKARPESIMGISSIRPSSRLEAREVGSTMVPLGFRRYKPQPVPQTRSSQTALPASQLRELLRIRTDLAQVVVPQRCSSATLASFVPWSPLPAQSMSAPPTGGLKQLHLPSVVNKRSSMLSTHSSSIVSSILSYHPFNASTPQSPSVSSTTSFSRDSLLSLSCKQIPEQTHHTLQRSLSGSPIPQAAADAYFTPQLPSVHHDLRSISTPAQRSKSWRLSQYRAGSRNYSLVDNTCRLSRRTSILSLSYAVDEEREVDEDGLTISQPSQSNLADGWTHPAPVLAPPVHAIATPKPTLLFAIASDDVDQVRQVLESGDAGPNDSVGPQSALAFTLTNDKLTHKAEIVKALLAYGANPSALQNPTLNPPPRAHGIDEPSALPPETTLEGMDPATRYFVARADAVHTRQTSQLIYRSFFRPLTRVRYDVIGQDWALEQLFRVLSMHSQKLAVAPIVVLMCGPSGHGKSLLARKFGFLLDVPTHTVNMTTLRSAHDIWQSYSMSPYEEPSSCTLAEFLIENEGKRCVVVLDEIEKVEDQKALWSLLMPWELGRCSLEAGKRHVDARNVIWLATSNVGHELVFEYHEKRAEPDSRMSREDYVELTAMLRPRVSHCLGASLVSRVTTVLPFVPFTLDEKKAIAAEAIYAFAGEASKMSPQEVESLVVKALPSYHQSEGARSLHRAISNILMDTI